jgi:hypothetical protein
MKLAFKKGRGFIEKEVDIIFNFGVLESLCRDLKIDFWQMDSFAKKDTYQFTVYLLYHGYLTFYKENLIAARKKGRLFAYLFLFKNPMYKPSDAVIWYEKMSQEAQKELKQKMIELSGEIMKIAKTKSKKKVS